MVRTQADSMPPANKSHGGGGRGLIPNTGGQILAVGGGRDEGAEQGVAGGGGGGGGKGAVGGDRGQLFETLQRETPDDFFIQGGKRICWLRTINQISSSVKKQNESIKIINQISSSIKKN